MPGSFGVIHIHGPIGRRWPKPGHVCQTFCLTATWLGLAPFCLMGLSDSRIEKDLGLDGITESVLYAAGVGQPPQGSSWAPLVRGSLTARRNRRL